MSTHTPTVLERILQSTREEVSSRKRELPTEELEHRALALSEEPGARELRFSSSLRGPGMAVIAEFKRRSPSAGVLRQAADVHDQVGAYERGGAVAASILTEGPNFGGSLEDLALARRVSELPLLRKDFIVDDYQLYEARVWGADAVLLIVAALDEPELKSLHDAARTLGLDVLVEVHDRDELQSALEIGAGLIGINNRDLRDFSVDVGRTARLMGEIPAGVTVVSESGIAEAEQLRKLEDAGVDAVLVGESLMRASDPEAALRTLFQ